MNQDWKRVEGMMIGRDLDPAQVAAQLHEEAVLAQLEWFPDSSQLLGINLAVSEDRIALVMDDETIEGPTTHELAEELAELFHAEVRIGSATVDRLPEDVEPLAELLDEEDLDLSEDVHRVIEIGRTPASSVPLLAALEGIDLADIDLGDGHRALFVELKADKAGWNFGELPLVTLTWSDESLQIFLVTDDHLEHIVTHNWGMSTLLVPGAHEHSTELPDNILKLVGDRTELETIAAQVPGADIEALVASAQLNGEEAVKAVVAALGLPATSADFLLGTLKAEQIEGASVHLAKGIPNAIGRSVDIMLSEPDSPAQPLWSTYQSIAIEKPWLVRSLASLEAVAGTALLTCAVRTDAPRSRWVKAGGVLGAFLLIDSIAEISLSSYLRKRHLRSENK